MRFSVLSSGSKANVTFVEAAGTRLLIDCGLSAANVERRLHSVGIDPASIEAIIITHEHSDHILGASVFSRRYRIPVFANLATAKFLRSSKLYCVERFNTGSPFWVGGMEILPFSIPHDAVDPVGFVLQAEGLKLSHVTDLGRVTTTVSEALAGSHAMVLESNHDQEMLKTCDYSWDLKNRIASAQGHLSNDSAGTLLADVMHSSLLHVVLAHISENSNRPELALDSVKRYLADRLPGHLVCASPQAAAPMFDVGETELRLAV